MAFIKMKEKNIFPQLYNSYHSHSLSFLYVVGFLPSFFIKVIFQRIIGISIGLFHLLVLEYCTAGCLRVLSLTALVSLESQANV